jgi:hypothetical protein
VSHCVLVGSAMMAAVVDQNLERTRIPRP